jgi:hypothetical protein
MKKEAEKFPKYCVFSMKYVWWMMSNILKLPLMYHSWKYSQIILFLRKRNPPNFQKYFIVLFTLTFTSSWHYVDYISLLAIIFIWCTFSSFVCLREYNKHICFHSRILVIMKPTRKEFNSPDKFNRCSPLQNLIKIHENVFNLTVLIHEWLDWHNLFVRPFIL